MQGCGRLLHASNPTCCAHTHVNSDIVACARTRMNSDITSVQVIKNEVGCRDDTVPKNVDTRRH